MRWVEIWIAYSAENELPNWKPLNLFFTDYRGLFSVVVDELSAQKQATREYRVIHNDCRGFNNLSHTIHFR